MIRAGVLSLAAGLSLGAPQMAGAAQMSPYKPPVITPPAVDPAMRVKPPRKARMPTPVIHPETRPDGSTVIPR